MKPILIILTIISVSLISCKKNQKQQTINTKLSETNNYKKEIDSLWQKSDFASAVGVILNGNRRLMSDMNQMDTSYSLSSRRKFNKNQLDALLENLSGKKYFYDDTLRSDCFQPYHGVYFYKNGEIKGRLAVCFTCSNYFTSPRKNGGINVFKLIQIFKELNLPTYNWDNPDEMVNLKETYSDYFKNNKSQSK